MLLESKNTASARAGAAAPNFYRASDLCAVVRAEEEDEEEEDRILGAMFAPREHAGLEKACCTVSERTYLRIASNGTVSPSAYRYFKSTGMRRPSAWLRWACCTINMAR